MTTKRPLDWRPLLAAGLAGCAAALNPRCLVVVVLGVLVVTPLEMAIPRREQRLFGSSPIVDLAHATATVTLSGVILGFVLAAMASLPGLPISADTLPLLVQLIIAAITAELGYYGAHRASHEWSFLWRFHRVHHSSTEMSWLAAARAHPIDQVILYSAAILPLHLAGISNLAYGAYGVVFLVQNLLTHANVDLGLGRRLRWFVLTPDFHQWHHATDHAAWNHNYASQLPVLDLLFRTAYFPQDAHPRGFGLTDPLPETYLGHLLSPMTGVAVGRAQGEAPTPYGA